MWGVKDKALSWPESGNFPNLKSILLTWVEGAEVDDLIYPVGLIVEFFQCLWKDSSL